MPRKISTLEWERLKCFGFYILLCIMIILLVIWNVMSGDANVFIKMFNFAHA